MASQARKAREVPRRAAIRAAISANAASQRNLRGNRVPGTMRIPKDVARFPARSPEQHR
jgi:hypothetical protein